MPNPIKWLIAFFRAYFSIKAEIQQKQEEHVGEVIQQNADLTADLKEKTHEAEVLSLPDRSESAVLASMRREERD